jgi:Mrp family chromosome partitioning ATPase
LLSQLPALLAALPQPRPLRMLGLTSCESGEGVSTVAAQLSTLLARTGHGRVLLVDANLAAPAAHVFFGLRQGPGLVEVLLDDVAPADVVQPSGVANLAILAAGQASGRLAQAQEALFQPGTLEALKTDFDLVVFDLPACRSGPFPVRLGGLLDGVLLVIEAERASRDVIGREKELLVGANVPLLGAVLNKRRQYVPGWLRRYL